MPLAVLVPERGGGCGDDRPEVGNIASRDRSKPRCRAFLKRFFRGGVDDIVVEEVGKPHSTRPLSQVYARDSIEQPVIDKQPDVPDDDIGTGDRGGIPDYTAKWWECVQGVEFDL